MEYVKAVVHAAAQKDVKGLITRTAALAISLLLCFAAGADLYAVLGLDFRLPGIGTALTGIFCVPRGELYERPHSKAASGRRRRSERGRRT